ncbi:OSK1 [Symbiodinium natans]|uniref:OSK1 protein n=1 Tax=Symbiodinium natans TaxID=878477 RepID=A0A812R325_9DINO|nr:OSK1 [Symbiodinium natans]
MATPNKMRAKSIGHYILGKTIGEGTFGKVKLGTHILTGEKVAVKILEKERIVDVADVERVAREIHILKLVQHPHIIQLYEIIETPRQLYLIMEYCPGGELFDYIVAQGRVKEREACRFFHQIMAGVEQIHRMNVVHRDLKPENLLLDEQRNIKIVDFGLSNTYQDGQLLKTACGSPCYAAPEMVAGQRYVPSRCDVWSCGVILFALVCGYLPFEDQNTSALYRKILNADYQAPKFISESVRDLIARMLNTDPEQRFTTSKIRAHAWYRQIGEASLSLNGGAGSSKILEEDVLDQLDRFGFPRDYAIKCLSPGSIVSQEYHYHVQVLKEEAHCPCCQLFAVPERLSRLHLAAYAALPGRWGSTITSQPRTTCSSRRRSARAEV